MTTCDAVRHELLRVPRETTAAGREHLASCGSCAAFAARLDALREAAERREPILPDAGFAARVLARLPEPESALGWAALRLLPVAGLLALLCAGVAFEVGRRLPTDLTLASSDDLLAAMASAPAGEPTPENAAEATR